MTKTSKRLMSGNEALARGAWEAGVKFAAGYPGTPSTDVLEALARYPEVHAQWSANEKVAFDEGMGAALGGIRSLVTMKHVGLNVAADAFMVFPYAGTNAGFVVLSADDPGMHSSQNEQDNRYFAKIAKVPLIEPGRPQECHDFIKVAFDLSEEFKTPVMFRTTTRTAHTKGLVAFGERVEVPQKTFQRDVRQYAVPIYRERLRPILEKKLRQMEAWAETCPINVIEEGSTDVGVISSGIAYQYARDVLPEATFFKLGMIYPLPRQRLIDFCKRFKMVYVIEELEPFIEEQLITFGITNVVGKARFTNVGELSPDLIAQGVYGTPVPASFGQEIAILPRPPRLCVGCGHRGLFNVLKRMGVQVAGDIGCYTMGALPPFEAEDTIFCMGASIGNAFGFKQAGIERTVAIIGDSTFIHAGIPSLIDAVYNQSQVTTIILDNDTTGMTGQQVHPGTGRTLKGTPTRKLDLEALVRAIGIDHVAVVDPWEMDNLENAIQRAMAHNGPAVVIARHPCLMIPEQRRLERTPYQVIQDECIVCGACYLVGCPAITEVDDYPIISAIDCTACTLCVQMCPVDAIRQN